MTKVAEQIVLANIEKLVNKFQRELYLTTASWAFAIAFLSTHASGSYADYLFPVFKSNGVLAVAIAWGLLGLGVLAAALAITLSAYVIGNSLDSLFFPRLHDENDELPKANIGWVVAISLAVVGAALYRIAIGASQYVDIIVLSACIASGVILGFQKFKQGGRIGFLRIGVQIAVTVVALFFGSLLLANMHRDEYKAAVVVDYQVCTIRDEILAPKTSTSIETRIESVYDLNKLNCRERFGNRLD